MHTGLLVQAPCMLNRCSLGGIHIQVVRRATDFIDGKRVIGGYVVSLPLAIVALVLYALLSAVAWYREASRLYYLPVQAEQSFFALRRMGSHQEATLHAYPHDWFFELVITT